MRVGPFLSSRHLRALAQRPSLVLFLLSMVVAAGIGTAMRTPAGAPQSPPSAHRPTGFAHGPPHPSVPPRARIIRAADRVRARSVPRPRRTVVARPARARGTRRPAPVPLRLKDL